MSHNLNRIAASHRRQNCPMGQCELALPPTWVSLTRPRKGQFQSPFPAPEAEPLGQGLPICRSLHLKVPGSPKGQRGLMPWLPHRSCSCRPYDTIANPHIDNLKPSLTINNLPATSHPASGLCACQACVPVSAGVPVMSMHHSGRRYSTDVESQPKPITAQHQLRLSLAVRSKQELMACRLWPMARKSLPSFNRPAGRVGQIAHAVVLHLAGQSLCR